MFNFTEIDPNSIGDGVSVVLPTGTYQGRISSARAHVASTGRPQIEIKVQVTEEPYQGAVRTAWIGLPNGPQDKVMYIWARVLMSIGVSAEKMKGLNLDQDRMLAVLSASKVCYIDYTAGNQDMGERDQLNFITKEGYDKKKANPDAFRAPAPQRVAPATAAAIPAAAHTATVPAPVVVPSAPGMAGAAMGPHTVPAPAPAAVVPSAFPAPTAAVPPAAPAGNSAADLLAMFGS